MRAGLAAVGRLLAVAAPLLLAGCPAKDPDPAPTLSLSPSGAIQATGPVTFRATATPGGQALTWTLVGPGSLSGTAGATATYTPPPGTAAQTATVTVHAGALSAGAVVTSGPAVLAGVKIPGLGAPVQVLNDAFEIPHVRCAATADCLAVQGWLHARDRLFQMDFLRRVGRGRLAELIGPLGLSQDVQLRTLFTARDGRRIEVALAAGMDAGSRALVEAYARGVNARIAEHRAGVPLPGEYRQLPSPVTASATDLPDWTVEDTMAVARLQQFQLSESLGAETDYGKFASAYGPGAPLQDLGKLDAWVRSAQPATQRTHTLDPAAPTLGAGLPAAARAAPALQGMGPSLDALGARLDALREVLRPLDGAFGSNNWVIDAAHSASGHAMVANDPHLALQYPPNFHLSTLTSSRAADGLDVTGGAFPGIPGALVGRGKHVGWGVTVVGYDVTDLYVEQFVDAGHVLFNGAPAAVGVYPQTYKVRTAAGLVDSSALGLPSADQPPAAVVVVPHHGPIVQAPDAAGKAFSVRWTGHETWTQDLRAILGLLVATSVDDAFVALKDFATGAQNFVLADDQGNIGYDPHALVPVRRFADPRFTAPAALQAPWFPLRGDGSAEWGTGIAADACAGSGATVPARTCFLADAELPQSKNPPKGYLATANADPLGVTDDNSPLSHPPYLSFEWDDSTAYRHGQIERRLGALTAGGGKISLADVEALQADHVSTIGRDFADLLAGEPYATAAASNPDLAAARAQLLAWRDAGNHCPTGLLGSDPEASLADPDPAVAADSAGCLLFHTFLRGVVRKVFADDLAVAGLGVSAVPAVKGLLYMLDPATPAGSTTLCNDVDAHGAVLRTVSCPQQVIAALVAAHAGLASTLGPQSAWRWGREHTFTSKSPFALVTTGYTAGPFARPGGAFTVDVGNPSLSATGPSFAFGSSANVRHVSVMDPASPVVRMQLPGVQRSAPFDVLAGPDLLGRWVRNEYFDMPHGEQIQAVAVSSQSFSAP